MEFSIEFLIVMLVIGAFFFGIIYAFSEFSGKIKDVKSVYDGNAYYIAFKTVSWDTMEELSELTARCTLSDVTNYPFETKEEADKVVELIKEKLGIKD